MNIGFANIYAFRPHMEHLYYLSTLIEKIGHNSFFLTCDGKLENCYPRNLRNAGKISECSKCIIGGIRSYTNKNVTSIKHNKNPTLNSDEIYRIALSSACSLNRTESDADFEIDDVKSTINDLAEPILQVYNSTIEWIRSHKIEGVVLFNGRMEVTKAITCACQKEGIPFITHERTWFGDGLRLNPGADCLSIKHVDKMVKEYDSKTLTAAQASLAGKLIAQRFLQQNKLEWRLYNSKPEETKWPLKTNGKRVLILPSSKNEFAGHQEWKNFWPANTAAIDDYLEAFNIMPEQVVIRCHPNWSENIGTVKGNRSLEHYKNWANKRNIHLIDSASKASTYDLIEESDIVIMNGGSSAVEAGACGKVVVCLGPSQYMNCNFINTYLSKDDLYNAESKKESTKEEIIKSTLRYVYLRAKRFPQFIKHVRAINTTSFDYIDGADGQILIDMLKNNEVIASDVEYSNDLKTEDDVCKLMLAKDWGKLVEYKTVENRSVKVVIRRRLGFRLVDKIRDKLKRGDR